MPTYMEREVLTKREMSLFHNVERMTLRLLQNQNATCHTICRDIAKLLDKYFTHHSGYFGELHEHSWLRFKPHLGKQRNHFNSLIRDQFIIDPYPVALYGGSIMVDLAERLIIKTPWNTLYKEADLGPIFRKTKDPLLSEPMNKEILRKNQQEEFSFHAQFGLVID